MPLDLAKLQNVTPTSDGWQCACPVCRQDGRDREGDHLRVWKTGEFNCIVASGDKEHNRGIWKLAGGGSDGGLAQTDSPYYAPELDLPTIYPPDCLDRLIKDYAFWEGRRISAETVQPFRGGIATQFTMKDRWVFPQFNDADEIIGFSGRCLRSLTEEERKWYGRKKWKHKGPSSSFIWGGLEEIEEARRVVLVESIGDGLALRENGVPENLCLFGTTMSQAVLGKLITLNPDKIIVAPNNDVKDHHAGQKAAMKIAATLLKFFNEDRVHIALPTPANGKDFGDMTAEEVTEWTNSNDRESNSEKIEE